MPIGSLAHRKAPASGQPGRERWIDQFYPNTMFDIEGNFHSVASDINTTRFCENVEITEELGVSAPASDAEFLGNCQVAKEAGLVGALAMKHPEHIGLTDILCPANPGVRHIERIRSGMQLELDGASR